ncbi:NUDIX hydrolase [Nocardia terpenica]|uniref:ADP-ribose pyrophosphatase n=1 Tax=Nocardia terpenica TaxID=455432 RepID=A0A161X8U8_9NOCA|nr:NUDIX hydrolase [Nocardia terpenica]KZM69518.1 ADP-ribose pyrophosphatase [Nocardia terpenica]MBF6062953.1 NUDIX hydrolase [Nocardia terpenica]MBF6104912.1 NUDIX hydrolase [Nocardia terpenica]MBF6112651.1 NUDIX hydrolase [Nocardia terpenica]MBF6118640.1 NUDIX hydrolase [Nocardia terpenica]
METLGSRSVYSNRWMELREDTIRRMDGSTGIYSVVRRPDFVMVVPMDGDRLHLVEQFRYPLGERGWEFPAGTLPGLVNGDPVDLAHRELREETGLRATTLTRLGVLAPAPGTIDQRGSVYLATGLTQGEPEREPEEQDMHSAWFDRAEVEDMIRGGAITCAETVGSYTLLLLHERAA